MLVLGRRRAHGVFDSSLWSGGRGECFAGSNDRCTEKYDILQQELACSAATA
jgi:hypothetical protein